MGEVCPHHVGEMYNGQVCETYIHRECNICGYDYDNPEACGHKEGQSYLFDGRQPMSDFVVSVLVGGSIGAGVSVGYYRGYAFDEQGNIARLHVAAGNLSLPTVTGEIQVQITDAHSLSEFGGFGSGFGVSASPIPLAPGVDIAYGKNEDGSIWYGVGISVQLGVGIVPFDVHAGYSYTWVRELNEAPVAMTEMVDNIRKIYDYITDEQKNAVNGFLGQAVL